MVMSIIKSVSVVVPVYNEAESLSQLLRELQAVVARSDDKAWEFIFVDDGSRDSSVAALSVAAEADPIDIRISN